MALYRSDVSGAFGRVDKQRLLLKLTALGVSADLLRVLGSWLDRRSAHVIVDGKESRAIPMEDMVYQGTVFGPFLWNAFFADAGLAVAAADFLQLMFADDLNAIRILEPGVADAEAFTFIRECQSRLHRWGLANGRCV